MTDMTDDTRRPHFRQDGSIDTGLYMARARRLRSQAAHRMIGAQDRPARRPRRWPLLS